MTAPSDAPSLGAILDALSRRRRLVAGTAFVVAVACGATALVTHRRYTATTAFVSQQRQGGSSRLSGLAAQLGVNLAGGPTGQSPAMLAELALSREVLRRAVQTTYAFHADSGDVRATYTDLRIDADADDASPARREDAAMRRLKRAIEIIVSDKTGILTLKVTDEHPELARLLADRLVEILNAFNVDLRRTQAAMERRFAEERLAAARGDLERAENRAAAFMRQNRVLGSPELTLESERLTRDVGMYSQVFTTLAQALAQARLDELRDTPVVTTIEHAERPLRPNSRGTLIRAALGLILGGGLGVLVALGLEFRSGRAPAADAPLHEASSAGPR